ncbi:hypothetical protein [Actinoplanes sp. L3-i22]|uniref:hypothetical protein n=1 Tax=Actinoplanes sp. L3-i22 TaxID=2836373 RepID=UPI001C74A80A|nr:hypothetical protein [Actinoplanes sp. L3-i22]BCY11005.1 hypothetical protein L3i22_060930 [Actinoplanes sp. L3-i22]
MNNPIAEAFRLLRTMHPTATRIVVEDTEETIWLWAVRGPADELLWFDQDNYGHHPDADALCGSPELDYAPEVISEVVNLLLRGPYPNAFDEAFTTDYLRLRYPEDRTLLSLRAASSG